MILRQWYARQWPQHGRNTGNQSKQKYAAVYTAISYIAWQGCNFNGGSRKWSKYLWSKKIRIIAGFEVQDIMIHICILHYVQVTLLYLEFHCRHKIKVIRHSLTELDKIATLNAENVLMVYVKVHTLVQVNSNSDFHCHTVMALRWLWSTTELDMIQ